MDHEEAADLCKEIFELIQELPERAADFGASIQEKVESIAAWIEKHEDVTERQVEALENMMAGIQRWL